MVSFDSPLASGFFTPDFAKNLSTGVSIGSVVFALVALKLVKSVVMRLISTVLLLAIGLAFYFQRAELTDCVKKVETSSTTGGSAVCTFFGRDVTIDVPDVIGN